MELRPYQHAQRDAIVSTFFDAGKNRALLQSPTGTGKTQVFASIPTHPRIAEWLATFKFYDRRMLVVAHREELIEQAAHRITQLNPKLMVSIEQGDRYGNRNGDVIVASVQTLAARQFTRLRRLVRERPFRIVIVDEAHHAAARSYRDMLAILGFLPTVPTVGTKLAIEAADFDDVKEMERVLAGWDERAPKDRLLVGVTATPNRSDAIGLGCVFQTIAHRYPLRQAIEDKWLVPIVPYVVDTKANLDAVHTARGDFNQKELAEAVNTEDRNRIAVDGAEKYARGLPTIAFTVDVQHAHDLCEAFLGRGVPAAVVSGETPKDERRHILKEYSAGNIQVLCNCMVLTEGTDLPRTACILMAKPTKSATLYEQMVGRGLRLFEGKDKCIVIDIVDLTKKHSLQTVPMLYGLPPGVIAAGKDLKKVADEMDDLRRQYPGVDDLLEKERLTPDQIRLRMATFDIWKPPSMGQYGMGLELNWIRVADTTFRLQYPWGNDTEIITVQPDMLEHFDVTCTIMPRDGSAARQRTLLAGAKDAISALKVAELYVNQDRRGAAKLVSKAFRANQDGAGITDAQIKLMKWKGIPFNTRMTKGEASDAIEVYFARNPKHTSGTRRYR